jgi:hypothetical protein
MFSAYNPAGRAGLNVTPATCKEEFDLRSIENRRGAAPVGGRRRVTGGAPGNDRLRTASFLARVATIAKSTSA